MCVCSESSVINLIWTKKLVLYAKWNGGERELDIGEIERERVWEAEHSVKEWVASLLSSERLTKFRKIDINKWNGKFQLIRKGHEVDKEIASKITRMF